jgi:CheY-like chemotaxis protein
LAGVDADGCPIVSPNHKGMVGLNFSVKTEIRVRIPPEGQAAVHVAARMKPDVALVDIGLPVLDGYEVARRIRVSPNGQLVGLIAVTGYAQPEDIERARWKSCSA